MQNKLVEKDEKLYRLTTKLLIYIYLKMVLPFFFKHPLTYLYNRQIKKPFMHMQYNYLNNC